MARVVVLNLGSASPPAKSVLGIPGQKVVGSDRDLPRGGQEGMGVGEGSQRETETERDRDRERQRETERDRERELGGKVWAQTSYL